MQLIASSTILSVMTGMDYRTAVVVVTVVVTVYSVLGGLWSVTLTDIVQLCIIVGGLLLAVPFAVGAAGGWDAVWEQVPERRASLTAGAGFGTIASLVVMYVASFAVGQETMQRYFAARDGRAATLGSLYAAGIYVLFAFVPALLGVVASSMVAAGTLDGGAIAEQGSRYVLPILASHVLPSWLVGLVFAALISATMSSADSDLLAAGSIISNDLYAGFLRRDAPERRRLLVTRLAMVALAAAAMLVALTSAESIIGILIFSFSVRAGGSFVPYVLGHYWRGATALGAVAAVVVGSAAVLLVELEVVSLWGLEPIVVGIVASVVAFVLASLAARRRAR